MCGIWGAFGPCASLESAETCLAALKARGPEDSRLTVYPGLGTLGFTRLAINGLTPSGMQPMERSDVSWVANGELYNWAELAAAHDVECTSGSDCEIVGALYSAGLDLPTLFRSLDGVFATLLIDRTRRRLVAARDPYGVRPLFRGWRTTTNGQPVLLFGSELKSLVAVCDKVEAFEPGHYEVYDLDTLRLVERTRYHTVSLIKSPALIDTDLACISVRVALETAVRKRLMTERPVAALLSGGVDSSLIAALVARELRAAGVKTPLKTFSIGMKGSTDLAYARKVADWIRSDHTEVVVTAEDMLAAVPAVIRDIESFDTTTVRASVGNWLVARAISRQSDCKVVFNGDGSDETFGSYMYFYNAPSPHAYEAEVARLLSEIHTFDVLRSDRSISSHGLEARTPFLDKAFVQTVLSVPLELRQPERGRLPEKWLLRRAFDDGLLLPREVLWRQKEAFSDGVSGTERSWFEVVKEAAEAVVPVGWKYIAKETAWTPEPATAEQFWYRSLFESLYAGLGSATVPHFWMPRWCANATDPSARTLAVYQQVMNK